MADYNINAVTRKVYYTGSAGVGPYSFSFEILLETDIAVYFNETLLTLTTDYTVTINANGTGSMTIVTGTNVPTTPDADDRITILGAKDIERTTDFVTAGSIRAASFNEQLDALTIFDQQISERVDRSIKAPAFDPVAIDMTLPGFLDRANKFLTFDSEGDVSTSALTGLSELIIDNVKIDGNTISSVSGGIIINPYSSEDAEIYDAYLRGSQITVQAPFKDVAGNTMMFLSTTRQSLYYSNTTAMRTEEGGAELFGSDNTFGGRIILTSTVAQDAIVDDDIAGSVVFQGYYPKPSGVISDFVYSTIESEVTDATTGSVNSQLNFKVAAQDTANAVTLSLFGGSTSATGPALIFGGGSLSSNPSGTGGSFSIQPSLGKISFTGNPSLTFGGRTITQGSIYSEGDFAASADGHLNLTNEYDFNKSIPIPLVQLYRDNTSPAAADKLGKISFRANDSLGNKTEYANIAVDLDDPTNGSEDGSLRFEVMQGGSVSTAMELDAAGVTIPGNLTVQGTTITIDSASAQTVDLGDNDKIRLGDGDDLQIYHDGTNSYISNSTGGLKLSGNVEVDDTDNLRLRFLNSGTFKAGVEVATDAGDMIGTSAVDDLAIRSQANMLLSTGGNDQRIRIASNGDISFYEDTGTTAKFFWDASAESLGIGTNSPEAPLMVSAPSDNTTIAKFGGSSDSRSLVYSTANQSDGASNPNALHKFQVQSSVGQYKFSNTANDILFLDYNGNVGIGTDSPAEPLHISNSDARIRIQDSDGTNTYGEIRHTTGALYLSSRVNTSDGVIVFNRDNGTTTTESMRIGSSGNVGIGTSSPNISGGASGSTALTVSASTADNSNRNGLLELRGTRSATGNIVSYVRTFNNSGATPITDIQSIRGASDTTGELTFETSGSEAMRIDSSGNLQNADYAENSGATNGWILRQGGSTGAGTFESVVSATSARDHITIRNGATSGNASGNEVGAIGSSGTSLTVSTAGSEAARIDSSGNVDLTNGGGDIIMANGAGIDFSASEGGGADNSLLDDYEEGTWTPVFTSWSTTGTTSVAGTYTKVGNVVVITGRFRSVTGSIASTGGSSTITGLPFSISGYMAFTISPGEGATNGGVGANSGNTLYAPTISATFNDIYFQATYQTS